MCGAAFKTAPALQVRQILLMFFLCVNEQLAQTLVPSLCNSLTSVQYRDYHRKQALSVWYPTATIRSLSMNNFNADADHIHRELNGKDLAEISADCPVDIIFFDYWRMPSSYLSEKQDMITKTLIALLNAKKLSYGARIVLPHLKTELRPVFSQNFLAKFSFRLLCKAESELYRAGEQYLSVVVDAGIEVQSSFHSLVLASLCSKHPFIEFTPKYYINAR